MSPLSPIPSRHPIRVVLSSTALLPFMSVWKAAALAVAQLGVAAFFIAGVTRTEVGASAPWFVLAATILAAFVRTIDVESWALLIPGGFVSRVASAFGPTAIGLAKAVALVERLLLGALACVVIGHYVASVSGTAIAGWRFTGFVRPEDFATVVAIGTIGVLWLPTRLGRDIGRETLARAVWVAAAIVVCAIVSGTASLVRDGAAVSTLVAIPPIAPMTGWFPLDALSRVPRRLCPRAPGCRRRRGAFPRGPRTAASTRAGVATYRPADRVVRRHRGGTRGVSRWPC